jgi:hypothetical protein
MALLPSILEFLSFFNAPYDAIYTLVAILFDLWLLGCGGCRHSGAAEGGSPGDTCGWEPE